ncbi:MAG TPA: sigma-54-dependent Fis family transcriptional regulator [Nitrospiria bacterium]|jgi:Nif-specific regulatory protein
MPPKSDEISSELIKASLLVNSSLDIEKVLESILQSAMKLIESEACSIMFLDEAKQDLLVFLALGEKGKEIQKLHVKMGQGVCGWVASKGKGIIVNDVSKDPRFFPGFDNLTGFKTRSILCAPLVNLGKVIGIIELLNGHNRIPFKEEDMQLLSAFASHAALAWTNAKQFNDLKTKHDVLWNEVKAKNPLVLGESPLIHTAAERAKKAAVTDSTILLLGESGTGKEVFSRQIHRWSDRANGPFIPVNCVALSEGLVESELFGHEKGAFTGAQHQRKGKLEIADGGTVFLDEIGDMKPSLQVKLLRFLQEKEFERVGGNDPIRANVRIIAATNRNLKKTVEEGSFRKDLYFRLNVIPIELPSLRERKEDISALSKHFLCRFQNETKRAGLDFSPEALEALTVYDWPGNVRELENTIERAVVLSSGNQIKLEDLNLPIHQEARMESFLPFRDSVKSYKKYILTNALAKTNGNRIQASKLLNLQPSYLSRLIKNLQIH